MVVQEKSVVRPMPRQLVCCTRYEERGHPPVLRIYICGRDLPATLIVCGHSGAQNSKIYRQNSTHTYLASTGWLFYSQKDERVASC